MQVAPESPCGFRNVRTFITMIYLIAAPLGELFKST
ncbi:transposase (fragment) [Magnetospirillum sp. LM-5]